MTTATPRALRRLSLAIALPLALAGCATEDFVHGQVGAVDTRLGARIDATQSQVTAQQGRLDEVDKSAREALERAQAAGKLAQGKFLYSVVLSDDSVKFRSDKAELSSEAQARLAEFVDKLKTDDKNVYIEIQGHTDASGTAAYNHRLGEARAEAVREFLNAHGVALNRMATISYGQKTPVASNGTRQGRAQNRRVVLVVLI
jgi:outer membrane protein OmpA-like peptidoglycan-associated protein